MVNKNSGYNILEYLQKNKAINTFKLASVLEIKRDKLLGILKNLEEQGLVRIITGKVEFLSYPSSKEKSSRIKSLSWSAKCKRKKQKPKVSKEKSEIQNLQEELENQKSYTEKLKEEIKKLEQRPPKVIIKTIIKEAKPKVITKTIVRDAKPIKTKRKKKKKLKKLK